MPRGLQGSSPSAAKQLEAVVRAGNMRPDPVVRQRTRICHLLLPPFECDCGPGRRPQQHAIRRRGRFPTGPRVRPALQRRRMRLCTTSLSPVSIVLAALPSAAMFKRSNWTFELDRCETHHPVLDLPVFIMVSGRWHGPADIFHLHCGPPSTTKTPGRLPLFGGEVLDSVRIVRSMTTVYQTGQ